MTSIRKFLLQFFVSCLLCIHLEANPLIGANLATPRDFNFYFTVTIVEKFSYHLAEDHLCTGSLIKKKYVLTSAQCLSGNPISTLMVVAGSTSVLAPTHQSFDIAYKTTYAQWFITQGGTKLAGGAQNFYSDICILELDLQDKNDKGLSINPVDINYKFDAQASGNKVTAIGWGHSQESTSPISPKVANMKILSRNDCQMRYRLQGIAFIVPDGLLCIVDDIHGAVAVEGDFGGPVLTGIREQIGILVGSGPMPKPHSAHPNPVSLMMPLSTYAEFIEDAIFDNELSPLIS